MSLTFIIANSLIIIINPQLSILSTWEEMLSFGSQVNCVQFLIWPFDWSNYCSVILLPISYLSVWTCCQNLVFLIVEKGLFEGGWFEQTQKSCVILKIPNNAWPIATGWDCLRVVFVDLNWPYSASVFLKWGLHDLSLFGDFPNSNFTFSTTWNDSGTICSCSYCCASMIMSVINDIQQFTRLRQESSDFTIAPSWNDRFSIVHEEYTVTFEAWNLNSQKFLSILCVPNSDFVDRSCCENIWETLWESNVIDSFVMTGVS